MSIRNTQILKFIAAIAAVIVLADQVSKWVIRDRLGPEASKHEVEVIGSWFRLVYTENSGVAFGAFTGGGRWLTPLVLLAAVGFGIAFLRTSTPTRGAVIGCAVVIGGAVGNLIDRIRFGYVVDFVDIGRWPTFNLADAAITVGTLYLLTRALFGERFGRSEIGTEATLMEIGAHEPGR